MAEGTWFCFVHDRRVMASDAYCEFNSERFPCRVGWNDRVSPLPGARKVEETNA